MPLVVDGRAPARLLPSGDAFFLLQDADRDLLVPDVHRQRELWTPRVWPGALLVDGEITGTALIPGGPTPTRARVRAATRFLLLSDLS